MRKIFFDMDGTIANLYGVPTWLDDIVARETRPYEIAKPMVDVNDFINVLNELKKIGYEIGIITWLAKCNDKNYNKRVAIAKREWLAKTFNFEFDEIIIATYGLPKQAFGTDNDILFDDEKPNREKWVGKAYDVNDIVKNLKKIAKRG